MAFEFNWPWFWKNRYETEHEEHEYCKKQLDDTENICVKLQGEIKELKALKIPQSVRPQVKEVSRQDGHIYFMFDDLTNLPYIRAQQIGHLANFLNCGINPDYMASFLKKLNTAIWDDKSPEQIDTLRRELEERFNFGFNTEMLYQIAANLILRDDEPHDQVPEMLFQEKIEHWKKSGEGLFFLTIAYSVLMKEYEKFGASTLDGSQSQKELKAKMKKEESMRKRSKKGRK